MKTAIKINNISKSFSGTKAVSSVDLEIQEGEMIALIGPSGSGKSTLLRMISGLLPSDKKDDCLIQVLSNDIQKDGKIAPDIRQTRQKISLIFQQFNLVGSLPVITNVIMGALGRIPLHRSLTGIFTKDEKQQAVMALKRVGLSDKVWQRASTLSGGQQQRVAIARALMQEAPVILADEPISSLDPESSQNVMEILETINKEDGKTIVVCLHQIEYALQYCQRIIAMRDGRILEDCKAEDTDHEHLRALYRQTLETQDHAA